MIISSPLAKGKTIQMTEKNGIRESTGCRLKNCRKNANDRRSAIN